MVTVSVKRRKNFNLELCIISSLAKQPTIVNQRSKTHSFAELPLLEIGNNCLGTFVTIIGKKAIGLEFMVSNSADMWKHRVISCCE